MCSFWYVEALARAKRLDEARLALEKCSPTPTMWDCSPRRCGRRGAVGELPQAFTHLALISAAVNLDRTLG
jgi:GH15 family glucan-1,4-alpha-glucosidase